MKLDRSTYLKITNAAAITLIFGIFLALSILSYNLYERKSLKNNSGIMLDAIHELKLNNIVHWFFDEKQDAELISSDHFFSAIVTNFLNKKIDKEVLLRYLNQIKKEHLYSDLVLLTPDGDYITSTNPALAFSDSTENEKLRQAIVSDTCFVSDLYVSTIDHRIYIDFMTVIKNADSMPLAGLILKLNPDNSLDNLLTEWPSPNFPGKSYLIKKEAHGTLLKYDPALINESMDDCWLPLTEYSPIDHRIKEAFSTSTSKSAFKDKNGYFCIEAVPLSSWYVYVELDYHANLLKLKSRVFAANMIGLFLMVLFFVSVYLMIHFRQKKNIHSMLDKDDKFNQLEDQFSLTMDLIGDGIILTDSEENIQYMNLLAESITGWKINEVVGRKAGEIICLMHEDTGIPVFGTNNWLSGERAFTTIKHVMLTNKEGVTVFLSCSITPIKSKVPNHAGMIISLHDDTEKRRQEKLIHKSERQFRNLFQDAPDAFIIVDQEGIIRLANFHALSLFEYSEKELTGMQIAKLIPFANGEHETILKGFFVNPGIRQMESDKQLFGCKKNGKTFPIMVSLSPVMDDDEMMAMAVIKDISGQKMAEEEARAMDLRFRQLVTEMDDIVWTATPDGSKILDVNPAFERICGIPPEMLKLNPNLWLELMHQDDRETMFNNPQELFKSGKLKTEYKMTRKDGTVIWLDNSISTVCDENGNVVQLGGIARDITKIKKYEEELIDAKNKAEDGERLKTAFLANISHEIRTPLNGIIGFSQLISDDSTSLEEAVNYAKIISESGKRLLELLSNIVELSRIDSKNETIIVRQFVVVDFMQSVYNQFYPLSVENSLDYRLTVPEKGNEITMVTDPIKLEQILNNLISNAFKFTVEGYIETGFTIENDDVLFYVKDTGVGINPDHKDLVFDRFFQAEVSTSRSHEGAGIGLSICKGYADLLGGTIWLDSNPDSGTIFYVKLPRIRGAEDLLDIHNF